MMNFKSDNAAGVHPKIMEAMIAVNPGTAGSYGHDQYTEELGKILEKVFEHECSYYFACTGTAANSLALSAICKPFATVFCSDSAHILTDECTAPSFFCHGVKLEHKSISPSKIDTDFIESSCEWAKNNRPHTCKPGCVSIAETTELGQVYSIEEVKKICDVSHKNGLKVHMDGARLANAIAALGCTPAEITWKCGVDVLTLGATKNGGLMGELIIFFDKKNSEDFDYIHKAAGQLFSKTRFFAAQMIEYFKDDLWLKLAKHSNDMAKKLTDGIIAGGKMEVTLPVRSNEIFVRAKREYVEKLWSQGAEFYDWDLKDNLYRFVTSWATTEEGVNTFLEAINAL